MVRKAWFGRRGKRHCKGVVLVAAVCALALCLGACAQAPEEAATEEAGIWLQGQPGDNGTQEMDEDLSKEGEFQGVTFKYSPTWSLSGMGDENGQGFGGILIIDCLKGATIQVQTYTHGQAASVDAMVEAGCLDSSGDLQVVDSSDSDGQDRWTAFAEGTGDRAYYTGYNDQESDHGCVITAYVYDQGQNAHNYEVIRSFMNSVFYDPTKTDYDCQTDDVTEYQRKLQYGHLVNASPEESSFVQGYLKGFGTFESVVVQGEGQQIVPMPSAPFLVQMDAPDDPSWLMKASRSDGLGSYRIFASGLGDVRTPETLCMWDEALSRRNDNDQFIVDGRGSWTLTLSPLSSMEPLVPGKVYEGDQVLYIDTPALKSLSVTCTYDDWALGASFKMLVVTPDARPKEFSKTAPFDVYVDVDAPQCVLVVEASGPWSIAWDDKAHASGAQSEENALDGVQDFNFAEAYGPESAN